MGDAPPLDEDAPDEALLAEDGRSSPTSVGRVRKRAQIGAQLARGWERGATPLRRRTALHLAASEGHAPAVRWLLLHGANAKALDGSAARLWTTHIARTGSHEVRQILQQSSAHTAGRASIASVAPQQQAEEAPVVRSASAPLPPQLPPPDESPPVPVSTTPRHVE